MATLRPLGDRVLVKIIDQEHKTKSGIVLPESAKEKSNTAEVIAVGPGKIEDGKRVEIDVKKGDAIIFSEYAGQKIKLDGDELEIIRADDILAVLEQKKG